jgi:hypothetical protein
LQCLCCSKCSVSGGGCPSFWNNVFNLTIGHRGQTAQHIAQISVGHLRVLLRFPIYLASYGCRTTPAQCLASFRICLTEVSACRRFSASTSAFTFRNRSCTSREGSSILSGSCGSGGRLASTPWRTRFISPVSDVGRQVARLCEMISQMTQRKWCG